MSSNLLGKVTDFFGGSIFKEAKDLIQDYWPPELSPEKKAELNIKLMQAEQEKQRQFDLAIKNAEEGLTSRIVLLEGSAQDLRAIPFIGPIVIFLRGLQRPVWGYSTLYFNYVWFVEGAVWTSHKELALIIVNLLVLSFLFGERAVQNLAPLIEKFIVAKQQSKSS